MKKVKKWLALGMTAVLSFALLASCASSAASSTAEETSAAETTLKAAMITPQKLGDDGPLMPVTQAFRMALKLLVMRLKCWSLNPASTKMRFALCVTTVTI